MTAECTRTKLMFQGLDGRQVVGRFDGGEITSDSGGVLLPEVEHGTRVLGRLSHCFTDHRDPDRVEHPVEALIKQRVLELCLHYEDLNDHDELCRDRRLALLCDRDNLTGEFRRLESNRGAAHGVVPELKWIVRRLREAWLQVRRDSGFSNEELMTWCEEEEKEQQMGLFADRTSSSQMQANQLRLYFSAFAYVMVETLRRVGLTGTKLARAQSRTLCRKLLKIGAQVRVTTRKVWLSFSESYPYAALLRTVLARVQALPLRC